MSKRIGRTKRCDVRDGEVFYYVERNGDPMLGSPWYRSGSTRDGQPTSSGPSPVVECLPLEQCELTSDLDVIVVWSPEITDDDIEAIAAEWAASGQPTMVEFARRALESGDEQARQRCVEAIEARRDREALTSRTPAPTPLSDHLLTLIVAVARERALHGQIPQPGDLVVATLGCPRPEGRLDPDAIGYLVGHGDAPLNKDGTGPVREVWDVRALSGRTHGGLLYLRWENVDFAVVSKPMAELISALISELT